METFPAVRDRPMTTRAFQRIVRYLHRAASPPEAAERTDGQLLDRFVVHHDSAAFESLMRRHGPLVWGVCRRLLRAEQDAEDAFQATFLILLRKAPALDRRPSLGAWLYGVAYRVAGNALKARAVAARHRASQTPVTDMPQPEPHDTTWHELRPVLDEELHQLPEKYRVPLVLCCLEGKTNEQAARELGWPCGSMSRRLARGRELLRRRLVRRGVVLSAVALTTLLAEHAAPAAPLPLVSGTLHVAQTLMQSGQATTTGVASASVSSLTEGVLKTMYLAKLKLIGFSAAACLAAAVSGTVLLAQPKPAPVPAEPTAAEAKLVPDKAVKRDLTPESFANLHALVRPHAGEWRHLQVQWLTDVVAARKKAATEDKPIIICYTGGAGYNEPLGVC
ncbi:hypothetical protein AYO44_08775 [Planctomycetaceae bacterium SCGC AG-212-F19]|nr:hypothetical protein AYO44_08775 [Planctomycetaceae bacterium SCGC AG-212-F19]